MSSERNRDSAPAGGGRFDADGDATRRTHLANERTYLAWWRTGLTCIAASVGVGRILPELTGGNGTLLALAGVAFALIGILFFGYGYERYRKVEAAVRSGQYVRPDDRFLALVTVLGVLAALVVLAIVVTDV